METSTEITIAVIIWIDNNLLNNNFRVYHNDFQCMLSWGGVETCVEPAEIIEYFIPAEKLPAINITT